MKESIFSKLFTSFGVTLCGFFFLLFLIVVYYSKKRNNEFPHKMFRMLIFVNLVAIILDFLIFLGCEDVLFLGNIKEYLARAFVLNCIFWSATFLIYLISTFYINEFTPKKKKLMCGVIYGVSIALWIISCFFNIEYEIENIYTVGGPVSYFLYIAVAVPFLLYIFTYFIKFKKMNKVQKILFALVVFIFGAIMQFKVMTNYEMNYIIYYMVVVIYMLYFTFESQAYIMSLELVDLKNKTKMLNDNREKYLDNASERLISPLSEIISADELVKKGGLTNEEIELQINIINQNAKIISSLLNEFDKEVKRDE